MNCFRIRFRVCAFCVLIGASLFASGLVILCFVYLFFVVVWLSVPVIIIIIISRQSDQSRTNMQ